MIDNYYDQISKLHSSQSLIDLKRTCDELLSAIGIQYYKYEWQASQYLIKSNVQRIIACPDQWMCHYLEQDFADIDPKLRFAENNVVPIVWTPRVVDQAMDMHEKAFWEHSMDFGLGYGATIPIRSRLGGKGMLCVALPNHDAEREYALNHLPQVEAMAHHLQNTVEQLLMTSRKDFSSLTGRESEVVKWTAGGKTASEISIILGISETTTLFHLKNAKRKLNVMNKHQLTARALALGML